MIIHEDNRQVAQGVKAEITNEEGRVIKAGNPSTLSNISDMLKLCGVNTIVIAYIPETTED